MEVINLNFTQVLFEKLNSDYIIKLCMNSLRVKICSIKKMSYPNPFSVNDLVIYNQIGEGDGPTSLDAIKAALSSFSDGYKKSDYYTGDTEEYNLLDRFVHTGYNVYMWFNSGFAIVQLREDKLCLIPPEILIKVEAGSGEEVWFDPNGGSFVTRKGKLDIMRNVNFPPIDTYVTTPINQKNASKSHHIFNKIKPNTNPISCFLPRAFLENKTA